MYQDKTLVCRDCGAEFVFTAGEQEFYAEKGFQNEPTRCKDMPCGPQGEPRFRSSRDVRDDLCRLRRATTVPFIPKSDRPIYCSECFAAHRQA